MSSTGAHRRQPWLLGIPSVLALALLIAGCASTGGGSSSSAGASRAQASTRVSRAGNAPFYEVMGQRYYVMTQASDYRERGVASWYGSKFHGRPTASGEIYDMYALSAAHKTLPIPTYVRVRNLANGRAIVVRVNDRGPFVKNRLIDLSYEAARRLELIGPGTGLVEVQVVPPPAEPPAPAPTVAATTAAYTPTEPVVQQTVQTAPPSEGFAEFFVQVGAFSDATNAQRMRSRLQALGFENVVVHRASPPEPAFRVRVGPFSDVRAYDEIVERMRLASITDTFLTGY
ncbi:MAG: septal ring lytic transglycosylase RlpA family protein [Pseudomonadota bacterium]